MTGSDVLRAVGHFNDLDFTPHSFRQLQPVLPQRPVDVQADIAYFLNDVSIMLEPVVQNHSVSVDRVRVIQAVHIMFGSV